MLIFFFSIYKVNVDAQIETKKVLVLPVTTTKNLFQGGNNRPVK